MTGLPLIDREVLDLLFDSIGADGARSVLELFIEESQGYLATIADALSRPHDAVGLDRVRRAAHALKSAAGQVGAAAMSDAALAVELAAAEAAAGLPQRAAGLQDCAAQTRAALTRLLAEG